MEGTINAEIKCTLVAIDQKKFTATILVGNRNDRVKLKLGREDIIYLTSVMVDV